MYQLVEDSLLGSGGKAAEACQSFQMVRGIIGMKKSDKMGQGYGRNRNEVGHIDSAWNKSTSLSRQNRSSRMFCPVKGRESPGSE